MSGRSLRRLPVLAQARHIGTIAMLPHKLHSPHVSGGSRKVLQKGSGTDILVWLDAMDRVVEGQAAERGHLNQK